MSKKHQTLENNRLLVAAIDFGTTYSGYAFSSKSEYEKDPSKISSNTAWVSGHKSLLSHKTPTCLLLKPDQSFDSFGYAAEDKYTELANDETHQDWYFFRRFKMMLHGKKALTRLIEIEDETGDKKLPARTVFAHGIRFLKTHLLEQLETEKGEIILKNEEIHWVLTVPAIWNDSAKQFMREAAEEAGILMNNLSLALEPEAAALYCRTLAVEKLEEGENSSRLAVFRPGMRYMILDLGGGTVDISVQEVIEGNNLKELHSASGGAWGGIHVDSAFKQFIIKIVGSEVIQQFKMVNPADDLDLGREFEIKKRSFGKNIHDKTTFRVPVSLSDIFEEVYEGESLKETIQQMKHASKVSWTGDKLRVEHTVFSEFFKLSFDSIVEHVQGLLKLPQCRGVDTLIMVGGYSECKMLQNTIKQTFSNKRVIIPPDPGLAVVKGAVLFGHNPKVIVSRMTKFSYGVQSSRDFEDGDAPEKQFKKYGRLKCKDTFSKHVALNTSVPIGDPLEPQYYRPLDRDSTEVVVPIYVSTQENPRYTTDADCECLGQLEIKLSETPDTSALEKEIEVKMTFGGTELVVEAKEVNSNTPCTAKFNFLSHHGD